MNRFSDYVLVLIGALLLGAFVHLVLPQPSVGQTEQYLLPASTGTPAQPFWNYDPARVRRAITPKLTDALCPPYSQLVFTEDGTYGCLPG